MPTPLLPFQHVMIPGTFLTGFLISPLLVLSRNFAQMPSHRLKVPEERGRNRKIVAASILGVLIVIISLPSGGWAGWSLGGRLTTAWVWAAQYTLLGGDGLSKQSTTAFGWHRWRRMALTIYWLAIITAAVGGWQTRLVRARRIRLAKNKNTSLTAENGGSLVNKAVLDLIETRDIRGNRRMHVALDLRRKFFHALAVIMFVPAIAIEVRRTTFLKPVLLSERAYFGLCSQLSRL